VNRQTVRRAYDVAILILSVYVIGQLSIEVILELSEQTAETLTLIDFTIACVFLVDWTVFFFLADRKGHYLKTRWLDLIASIPFAQVLRPLRVLRVVRLARTLRLVRGLKGMLPILRTLTANPARSALTIYLALTTVIYVYCTVGLFNFEKGINESIATFGDALWLAFTTLTSVGYGDLYPITSGGRIMAVILTVVGMGLFGLATGEIAALILRYVREDKANESVE
jgi:voltage-gated potassium channel